MRRFSADYLADTRRGLWEDRSALSGLSLGDRQCVLDVGCGSGALTAVLREEVDATAIVIGVDADAGLLEHVSGPTIRGAATQLPVYDDTADLVTCQALLVNLPEPTAALREFARVSSDLVAVIEPDNSAVAVESTVGAEATLAADARSAYIDGVLTDVTLGTDAPALFRAADLTVIDTATHHHRRVIEPPYSEAALESARRKARGTAIQDARAELLAGGLDRDAYEALLADWRSMGRTIIDQMSEETYRRAEVIPFHVVVGRVTAD